MKSKGSSMFLDDSVCPSNLAKERLKCVKSKGATRGNVNVVVDVFVFLIPIGMYHFCLILTRVYDFV